MKKLMLGNEAIARGAYEAGVTVSSAYPGTPSTEISEYMVQYPEIDAEWAPNEKVALEVAIGGSYGGARSCCAMKHVGLNVAADPLFTAAYTGVNGGLVVFVADDPGMHSSQNEQDTRLVAKAAKIPVLEPADSAECLAYTREAFRLSETFDTPVIVRLTTRIAHSQGLVTLSDREAVARKPYVKNPGKYVMMPAMAQKRHLEVEKHLAGLRVLAEDTFLNRLEENPAGSDIGIITSGVAYQYAREVFPDAHFLTLWLVHPLPVAQIRRLAEKVKTLYVVEELAPFIEEHCATLGVTVIGKSLLRWSAIQRAPVAGKAAENPGRRPTTSRIRHPAGRL
jgi:indolepyruvate ferredoxin oxidoreductase alpha subunit